MKQHEPQGMTEQEEEVYVFDAASGKMVKLIPQDDDGGEHDAADDKAE